MLGACGGEDRDWGSLLMGKRFLGRLVAEGWFKFRGAVAGKTSEVGRRGGVCWASQGDPHSGYCWAKEREQAFWSPGKAGNLGLLPTTPPTNACPSFIPLATSTHPLIPNHPLRGAP